MFPWTARFEALFASSLPSRRPSRPFNSVQRKEIRKQSQDERAISSKKVSKLLRQACLLSSLSLSPLSASRFLSRGRFFSRPQTPLELNSMSHARRGDRVGERKRPRDRGNSVRTTETLAAAAATRGLRLREELQIDFSLKIKRALLLRSLSLFRPLCAGQGGREPPSWRGLRTD